MIFEFKFIYNPLNKVDEIPRIFLEMSLIKNRFSQQLFPAWFRPVLKKLPAVELSFRSAFMEIHKAKKLRTAELKKLLKDLIDGYDVKSLCEKLELDAPKSSLINPEVHESLKALFGSFFENTLKESKTLFDKLKSTYEKQYQEFRLTNLSLGKVCPMCGIHEYPLRTNEPKAQYDHWLPQDIYPLLAINFYNLVPICGLCNNIKLNKDLLFDLAHNRTVAFYPYQNHGGLEFNVSDYKPLDKLSEEEKLKYSYGKFEWDILAMDPVDSKKILSWDRVFNIRDRYSSYLSDYFEDIKLTLKEFLDEKGLAFADGSKKEDMMDVLDQFQQHRIKDIRRERGAHLKRAYLRFISKVGNEHLLYTLFGIKSIAA